MMYLSAGSCMTRDICDCELEESSNVQPVGDNEFMYENDNVKWCGTQLHCVLVRNNDDAK